MTDQELRALVRDAVARHLGPRPAAASAPAAAPAFAAPPAVHASHAVYVTLINSDESCVIEPGVRCNHCNYCRSLGH